MRITRLRITNYRGVAAMSVAVPPKGAIIKGPNGAGKSSAINAIRAALAARDVGPDAIRMGEERAEILVDLDAASVRRVITTKGTTLTITTPGGDKKASPQTWLRELLGTAPLDPIELYAAEPKKRRAIVLGALPVRVTDAQARTWIGADILERYPWERPPFETLHGLEACKRLHDWAYEIRKSLNALAKSNRERATVMASAVESARKDGVVTVTAEALKAAYDGEAYARDTLAASRALADRLARAAARGEHTRKQIAELRTAVALNLEGAKAAPTTAQINTARAATNEASSTMTRLEAELAAARGTFESCKARERELAVRVEAAAADAQRATQLSDQADALEQAIKANEDDRPGLPVETAEANLNHATETLRLAHAGVDLARMLDEEREAAERADEAERQAGQLTAVVDRLAKQAPAELIAGAGGIEGLGVDGDAITLDGVSIDALSGREQLRFATEVARRANAQAKILIVDGLERLDPAQLTDFVREATRDDWQLIATRVDGGGVVLESIEPEPPAPAEEVRP